MDSKVYSFCSEPREGLVGHVSVFYRGLLSIIQERAFRLAASGNRPGLKLGPQRGENQGRGRILPQRPGLYKFLNRGLTSWDQSKSNGRGGGPLSGSSSARRIASRNLSSSRRSRSLWAATSRWNTSSARDLSSSSPLSRESKSLPPASGCLALRWERTVPVETSITRSDPQSGQRTVSLRSSAMAPL